MSAIDQLIRSYPELGEEEKKSAVLVKVNGIDRDEFVGSSSLMPDLMTSRCYATNQRMTMRTKTN